MENTIFRHIEFWLPKYGCIIVPNLGGFILNVEPAYKTETEFFPPVYGVVFNPDLKYNDGGLASLIQQSEKVSYSSAVEKIAEFVRNVKQNLNNKESIICGSLGILSSVNGKIVFASSRTLVYPELFGMQPASLMPLSAISYQIANKHKTVRIKQTLIGIASAVAALVLFITPYSSVNDKASYLNQQAGFLSSINNSSSKVYSQSQSLAFNVNEKNNVELTAGVTSTPAMDENIKEAVDVNDKKYISANSKVKKEVVKTEMKSSPSFFLIIGGEDDKVRANRLLTNFKKEGFGDARIVESKDKYRIYIASFVNKNEADQYVKQFRLKNPKYKSAWIYAKK